MTDEEARVARAICAEKCAFRGEPPCWSPIFDVVSLDACNEPGCTELARAAIAAMQSSQAERIKELEDVAAVAIEEIEAWAEYASPYFRDKHDLEGVLADLRARAALGEKTQKGPSGEGGASAWEAVRKGQE